ncbi:hypothetical protein [Streptococcus orisasini]|uniref:hypothetical protein n=1 Tax=Streptococcus orisasini TaxID=1080071 RepID=UPI00070C0F73|nr:hypothetical protein [Streptococcus orisasini]
MEKRTDVWKTLSIVFIVLTSLFFITSVTLTTVYLLSYQDVEQLVEQSQEKANKISDYRKTIRKYKEKEALDYIDNNYKSNNYE